MSISNLTQKTPLGNTGVSPTAKSTSESAYKLEYKVDWASGTFPIKYIDKVIRLSECLLGQGNFQAQAQGMRYFNKSFRHPSKAIIGTGRKIPGGQIDDSIAFIEFSGSALTGVKQSRLRKLLSSIHKKCQFNPTRLDLAIDDYSKNLPLDKIQDSGYQRNYVGFGNTFRATQSGYLHSKGQSVSFGNRGSKGGGKYLIFYDKSKESKGQIDSIRVELSCYDHYCKEAFDSLINNHVSAWGEIIHGWIAGAIDFKKRKSPDDKNPGRRRRFSWWQKFITGRMSLKASRVYKKTDIKDVQNWIKNQVAPNLAVLINYFSKYGANAFWEWFWEIIFDGESRFRDRHLWLINSF